MRVSGERGVTRLRPLGAVVKGAAEICVCLRIARLATGCIKPLCQLSVYIGMSDSISES